MKSKEILLSFVLALSLFCTCFYFAWQVSAASNFMYSTWYKILDIESVITTYSPKNINDKHGFEALTKAEHVKLFAEIVSKIQKNGVGLNEISYEDHALNKSTKLLTQAEVIHLQDVANLVSVIKKIGLVGLFVFIFIFAYMTYRNLEIANLQKILTSASILIAVMILGVLVLGPTEVFYLGHELVFPDKHQWFFYYEESLMSTMMKAPALFGPIACQLLILTLVFWLSILFISQKLYLSFKTV